MPSELTWTGSKGFLYMWGRRILGWLGDMHKFTLEKE